MTSPLPPSKARHTPTPETCTVCGARVRSVSIEETRPSCLEVKIYGGLPEARVTAEPCGHHLPPDRAPVPG